MHMNKINKWLTVAKGIAAFSKDPSSQVGCVILDSEGRSVSHGYNGFIAKADETKMSWDRPMKYHLVVHAEMNAVLQARRDLKDCVAIVTDAPCDNCLKHIIQAGIKTVFYGSPDIMVKRGTPDQKEAIKRMVEGTGVSILNIHNQKSYVEELEEVVV